MNFGSSIIKIVNSSDAAAGPSCSYTNEIKTRKRIYGEEYRAIGEFCEEPKAKQLKLCRLEFETATQTNASASASSSSLPSPSDQSARDAYTLCSPHRFHPTKTTVRHSNFELSLNDIPTLCDSCYSRSCHCFI